MASNPSRAQLEAQVADLRAQRAASGDPAEQARLLARIREVEDQIQELDLQAGRIARGKVDAAAEQANAAANRNQHDVASSIKRTVGGLSRSKPKP